MEVGTYDVHEHAFHGRPVGERTYYSVDKDKVFPLWIMIGMSMFVSQGKR